MSALAHRKRLSISRGAAGLVLVLVTLLGAACVPDIPPNQFATHPRTIGTNPADKTPHVLNGRVHAVLDLGARVIVGGDFTQVKKYSEPTIYARRGIFAYDKASGAIDRSFVPRINAGMIYDMVFTSTGIIIGGSFSSVNGVAHQSLAKIHPRTGALVRAFGGFTDGWVTTMSLRGGRLFIGGAFSKVDTVPRKMLASVRADNGFVESLLDIPVETALRGSPVLYQLDATRTGRTLVITGNFTRVGGLSRHQVAIINVGTSSSTVSSWATNGFAKGACGTEHDYYVKDVDIAPDDRYFTIATTGEWRDTVGHCGSVSRWELGRSGAGQLHTWADYTGGDSLSAVVSTGSAVYAAGHQRWANNENAPASDTKGPGALDRAGIAAYDPATGTVLPWTIQRDRGLRVGTLTPTDAGLWIGSDSAGLGNEWHPRLGFIPL
jgi:hypothetical protein